MLHKYTRIFYPVFVQYPILCFPVGCDILFVSRGGNTSGVGKPTLGVELLAEAVYDPTFRHATFLKIISRNPLTNHPMYDTIRIHKPSLWASRLSNRQKSGEVKVGVQIPHRPQKKVKKKEKKFLTNRTEYAIIRM